MTGYHVAFGGGGEGEAFIGEFAPVFVVGMPRSGTTLLASLLSAHSKLAIGPETAYFNEVWKPVERASGLSVWPPVEQAIRAWVAKPSVGLMQLPLPDLLARLQAHFDHGELTHARILGTVMETYAGLQGKPFWGEKTPGHFMYVPVIKREFPSAKIIHIVRDPRDIHLSLTKVPWKTGNALNHAVQWREYQSLGIRYQAQYGHAFQLVRYEDLIVDPAGVLKRLTEAIGLAFEPEMLVRYQAQALYDPKDEPWKQRVAGAIDPTNAGKWRKELAPGALGIFEALCGRDMRQLGYDPPPAARFSPAVAVAGLDVAALVWWGRILWRIQRGRDPWLGRPVG